MQITEEWGQSENLVFSMITDKEIYALSLDLLSKIYNKTIDVSFQGKMFRRSGALVVV